MITLTDYWQGRDKTHPLEMSPGIENNALRLLSAVNLLLTEFGQFPKVTSGWRPPSYNATVPNAARRSKHMTGQAIDLLDEDGVLDAWLLGTDTIPGELDLLARLGLWMEHPATTKGWCHLQSVPPRSGNRVFYP